MITSCKDSLILEIRKQAARRHELKVHVANKGETRQEGKDTLWEQQFLYPGGRAPRGFTPHSGSPTPWASVGGALWSPKDVGQPDTVSTLPPLSRETNYEPVPKVPCRT